jgi:alanyl-tRNA synthetase
LSVPTERLYYTDAYLREFDANVVDVCDVEGRPGAVLDRTAFYPTSGGQPHDTGTLGGARVVDVLDRDDGTIVHVVEGGVREGSVHGVVDWERRFDHMQQHTGQHVLSAAFEQSARAKTISFHLGSGRSTIDLARDLSLQEIACAEAAANLVVWEDRPVSIRFAEGEAAVALPLRKETKRTGTLRIVDVENCDVSACGGTHVSRTGAIGLIAVVGSEKYKGGTRVEFACGGRALREFSALRQAVTGSIRQISVLPAELPDAIARLQADAKGQQKVIRQLQERLAGLEADAFAARAVPLGDARVVIETAEWDAAGLKALAMAIASAPDRAAVLFNPAGGLVVAARGAGTSIDAASIVKELTGRFGGRGGGRADLAQAGGLTGQAADVLETARRLIAPAG